MGLMARMMENQAQDEGSPVNRWQELAEYAVRCLEEIREGVTQDEQGVIEPASFPFVLNLDGAGNATREITVNPGVSWRLIAAAYQVTGVPAGTLAFYQDKADGTGLLKARNMVALEDSAFQESCFIAPQSRLLIVATGGPANGTVAGRLGLTITTHGPQEHTTHGGTN